MAQAVLPSADEYASDIPIAINEGDGSTPVTIVTTVTSTAWPPVTTTTTSTTAAPSGLSPTTTAARLSTNAKADGPDGGNYEYVAN